MSLRDAFVSAPFVVLALTFFACCAAHAGPIFHTVTYAMTCGLAPLAGGWIFDAYGSYTWLYVGSFAVGLGAVAIALAFPPFKSPAKELAYG